MRGKKISVIMIVFVCLSILTACGNNKGAGDFSFEVVNEKQVYDICNPAGYTVDEEGTIYTLTYQKGPDFEGIELGMYDLEGNLKEKDTLDNSLEICSELKLIKKIAVKGKELYIVLDNVGVLELYTYNLKTKAEEYVQTFAGYTQIYSLIPAGKSLYFSGADANEAEVFGYMDLKKKAIHTVEAEEFCTIATESGVTTDSVSKGVLCVGKQVFYQNEEKQLGRMSLEEYIKEKNRPNTYMEMGTKEEWQAAGKTGINEADSINLKINMGMSADYGVLPICHNEAYDAIYYIDYSDNCYIYRCKNNEVRLAVKIPADNLYVKDDDLYFMVKEVYEGLTGVSVGDICKYSPVTGAVERVIGDMGATWMTVSDTGIYYSYLEPAKQVTIEGEIYSVRTPHTFYYSFEEKESKEVKAYPSFILWKDEFCVVPCYFNVDKFDGLGLHKIGDDVLKVEPLITNGRSNYFCVQGDVLYCEMKGFNIIQLDTGEVRNYPRPVEKSGSKHSFGDFMVHNGRVYTQNLTCYVDLETGEYQLLREKETESDSYKNGERSGFSRLFNVDGRLFGLYYADGYHSYYPKGNPELVEILVEDEVKLVQDEEGNIYGEPVVYYSLKRMGETESTDEAVGIKEDWQAVEKTGVNEKEKINIKRDLSEMPDCDTLPICYNEAYDAVYYTNFADNSFIYRCKDNEVKLAVKVPADNLYAKDGDIYFRATGTCEASQDIAAGDICRYSPVTGKVEVIVKNANAVWMTVSDEGINYDVQKEKETVIDGKKYYSRVMNSFCYKFEKKSAEETKAYSGTLLWKDNYGVVPYSPYMVEGSGEGITGLGLYKIGTDMAEVKPIILGARYNDYCIQGDTLYCAGGGGFKIVRLDTGEIKEYSGWTSANGRTSGLGDFMIHNNRVYSSSLMYYIDLETGEAQELKGEAGGRVSRLFNVNDKLYGVYYEKGRQDGNYIGTPEIVEIEVDAEPTLWQEGDWIFGEMVYYRFKKIGEQ